jgi:hypothetical protein
VSAGGERKGAAGTAPDAQNPWPTADRADAVADQRQPGRSSCGSPARHHAALRFGRARGHRRCASFSSSTFSMASIGSASASPECRTACP